MDRPCIVTAFAPATVSNVACGFDVLGLRARRAGRRGDGRACARPASASTTSSATAGGCRATRRATPPASPRGRCSTTLGERRGVALTIRKGLPLSSGLGGSAASAAAAVVAVDALLGAHDAA